MAKAPAITTNIMSFKTFRSPDKISYTDAQEFFIHHPNLSLSKFNKCPVPQGDRNEKVWLEFLAGFKAATNYRQIREMNPTFYDYSCLLMQQNRNDDTKKQLNAKLPGFLNEKEIVRVWDELFYQVASKKSNAVRQACTQLIITQHYLVNNDALELKDISKLTILIPDMVIHCFKPWNFRDCNGELFGVHNLGIQEYRRVEQTLCCYVPGEVSHIDNIMAKEYKERSTRNYLRTEYSTEITSETEIENINDSTTTERNEISSEVAKELQKDKSFNLSGSVTVSKDSKVFGSISANVSTGYSSNNSSSLSNTEAKNYAKEVTERALERVVQKTTEKRTYKMIKEFEENNKHGFDNRKGTEHITGVYRWVDKIYDNELVNYGRRLLFEVTVPSPADFYKKAMLWKSKAAESSVTPLTPPKTLADFGIESALNVNSENGNLAASAYGTSISDYESETQYLNVDIPLTEVDNKSYSQTLPQPNIIIPNGFVAERIDGVGSFNYKTTTGSAYIEFNFGGYKAYNGDWKDKGTKNFDYHFALSPKLEGSIPFITKYRRTNNFSGSFKVKCVTDPAMFQEWQEETYTALQAAYQSELDAYNQELQLQQAAQQAEADQQENENYSNPAMNRLIEERELKRLCIEMMSKPYCYDMGQSFSNCKTYACKSECGEIENKVTEVVQNESLERYAEFIRFFETAFHWEIFSYIFYPYYYNAKCQWSELLQTKHDDPIFEAFLQSGMSKVLVPVRPQFEKAVMWYLETGEIYTDENLVPEFDDDRYLSLLKDLLNQDEIKVEGTWKTRVPSSLTIIQAKSSYLEDEDGLPCCDEDGSVFGSKDWTLESTDPE